MSTPQHTTTAVPRATLVRISGWSNTWQSTRCSHPQTHQEPNGGAQRWHALYKYVNDQAAT